MKESKYPLQLGSTGINLSADVSALHTSDELGWPGLNVSVISYRPYEMELVHGSSQDLWLHMPLDPLDLTYVLGAKEQSQLIQPGQIGIVSPGMVIGTRRRNEARCLHVFLISEIVHEVAGELFDRDVQGVDIASAFAFEDPGIATIMTILNQALANPACHSTLAIEHLARGLAANVLARHLTSISDLPNQHSVDPLTTQQAHRVTNYIRENLASDITLNDLAAVVGINRSTFVKRFRASFQQSPYQYLIHARIRWATTLLASNNLAMAEIALVCGFADQGHFSTCFKQIIGVPPMTYRQQLK
jgi:AraC-like DNA-binding protein